MCVYVTFNLIFTHIFQKLPQKCLFYFFLSFFFFYYSPSAWSVNHFLLLPAAGLAIRKTFSQRLEQVWWEGWAHPFQLHTWSSRSCPSSSKQIFVCLKWHPQPVQPLCQSQSPSLYMPSAMESLPGLATSHSHWTQVAVATAAAAATMASL